MMKPQLQSSSSQAILVVPKPALKTNHGSLARVNRRVTQPESCRKIESGKVFAVLKEIPTTTEKREEKVTTIKARVTVKSTVQDLDDIFLDVLGKSLRLEILSAEFNPSTGIEKETIRGYVHRRAGKGKMVSYEGEFKVKPTFGPVGAVLVTHDHHKEMVFESIVLEGLANGPVHITCNSCVHAKGEKRVFFADQGCFQELLERGLERERVRERRDSSGTAVAFPLLKTPIESTYRPGTIPYRLPFDPPHEPTPTELAWIDLFQKSIPSFRKQAESDDTVPEAHAKAEKFAKRYTKVLEDLKADPQSHGVPLDCILLSRLREQALRDVGFRDIYKKVKVEENANALTLFNEVVQLHDSIEDASKRVESLIRGVFAGNIFDLGCAQIAEAFARDGMSFRASCENLVARPWVIDDLDIFKSKWSTKSWKKAVIFVDNSGADVILGMLPFARELLRRGTQLKDENGKIFGVDASGLSIVNSGNDLPVIDLSMVSPKLSHLANDADLVILEGMGRGIETNLYAQFRCDSLNIGMVKHPEVAEFLGGRLYDCVFKYTQVL
ncbi:uncharacterized protein At2g17340 isoform X2 [Amborella trichopoda]|uniref:uncharacterized protein At2g17340 isoform X2 n=1 Tax=Amborella trichopoda TaxID=13333 RepID=UPI0009C06681|nr:uncharacterized protein At2g17340 isoform X2 [Amborella trichopoda]|eukprot:XP_020526328.1 uncharacterized protein At2g17340 isoform X2 [Amborella trichopoda]